MKVGIIGASASGIYAALFIAKSHPDWEITLMDQAQKVGKKLYATGNGHCNLFHVPFEASKFNQPKFVQGLLRVHPEEKLLAALSDLGIAITQKGELLYPLSYSAPSFVAYLESLLRKYRIQVVLETKVVGLEELRVHTDKGDYEFDHIIFAFGGQSQPNLGSDGSMFSLLKEKGFRVTSLRPSLCPIQSKDVFQILDGVRHSAKLTLLREEETIYQERGEVQFKTGLVSGIAAMNASSFYRAGDLLELDLFPEMGESELEALIMRQNGKKLKEGLLSIFEEKLAIFITKRCKLEGNDTISAANCAKIVRQSKHLKLGLSGLLGFASSQVTRGGIDLSEVGQHLQARKQPHYHFVGECLDIDGLCGGYNLGFALLSALEVAENL